MNCPNCNASNSPDARFCSNCGTRLVVEQPVRGERRIVTVLFADVVESTAMAESIDPEQVTEIMNGAFAFMNEAVERYGGTVARLMGDAIMAFFGAPVAHENDPERAVRAGLDIARASAEYSQWVQTRHGHEFSIRVGINTGLVVLATVGDEIHSEYTVMGDTVNTAARLQQNADPDSVLISSETFRHVQHLFEVKTREPILMKGKREPVLAYEVTSELATPGRARGLSGITSPMVGREAELQQILARIDQVKRGPGGLIAVIGEAGLGKSRLVAEVRSRVTRDASHNILWLEGRALSHGAANPYQPWREVMRNALGVSPADPATEVRERLRAKLQRLELSPASEPFLEAILEVGSDEHATLLANMEGNALRHELQASVRAFIAAMSRARPLALVLEDLHWADSGTFDLLRSVAELVERHQLLIVAVLRPDRDAPGWQFVERAAEQLPHSFTEVRIGPLDSAYSGELLANLLYIEELPSNIREMILSKSDGNPFFLEEVIRTMIDDGHIVRQNDHWRATQEIVNLEVPDTLVGVLSARIDRLPPKARSVAQIASVIGRVFALPVLERVSRLTDEPERIDEPESHLQRLTTEELIRERSRAPYLEYIFKHVLTQEAAYNLMLVRIRRKLHIHTGEALETLYQDRIDEVAGTLAFHFYQGEDWNKAIKYSLIAGERAEKQLFALREAHSHFERAYEALAHIPDVDDETIFDVILAGAAMAAKFLSPQDALDRLHRAEIIARERDDRLRIARTLHWIAHIHATSGFASRAMPALMENTKLAEDLGDMRLAMYPAWLMSLTMLDTDPQAAAERLAEIGENAETARNDYLQVHGFSGAAIGFARLGKYELARSYIDRARIIAERTVEPVTAADFHLARAIAHFAMGELEKGIEAGVLGRDLALESRAMECVATGYCIVGMGNLMLPRPETALETFEDTLQFEDLYKSDSLAVNQVNAGMALSRYATGKTDTLDEVERAKSDSEALGDVFTLAEVSLVMTEALEARGETEQADQHLESAIKYYRGTGMLPYLQRTLDVKVRILKARGDSAGAAVARSEFEVVMQQIEELNRVGAVP